MMAAHSKYPGNYAPVGHDGQHSEHEWSKILTQKKFLCIWLLIALIPFAMSYMYFSRVSIIYSGESMEASVAFPSHQSDQINHGSPSESSSAPNPSSTRGQDNYEDRNTTGSNVDAIGTINTPEGTCNIWEGEWVPGASEPLYTNATCWFIQEHQNCMKNGKPDDGYLHWRWKPTDCELPRFDATTFLKRLQGKAWAFIGDSISRNHFQSLLCSLAQAEIPTNIFNDADDKFVTWFFPSYNFTLAVLWSPFLVQETEVLTGIPEGTLKLNLDIVDRSWKSSLYKYDYVVLSSGQWFLKSSVYLRDSEIIGCHYCPGLNITEVGFYFAYKEALKIAFDFITSSPDYKGITIFRTFTPDHFENGRWDNGGNCPRTIPFLSNNTKLEGMTAEMYKIQLDEFRRALQKGSGMRSRLKLADTIHASLLRPDGHPGPYRYFQPFSKDKNAKVQNDCLHWCLPGPIDTWNEMLLEMLKHF